MSDRTGDEESLQNEIDDLRHRLSLVKQGLSAVLHILDANPELIIPAKSLIETMIKIVDD
jgi:hypothetical protein